MENQDKTVLITGGTSGMGLATARLYIQKGAEVIITGRYQETLDETVEQLGPNAHGLVSDAGKMTDIRYLQQQVKEDYPPYRCAVCKRRLWEVCSR